MIIGENIRKYRKAKGFNKKEFAAKAEVSVQALENFEMNKEPAPELDTILKISILLDIPASDLVESPMKISKTPNL